MEKVTIYGCIIKDFHHFKKVYYWTNPHNLELQIGDKVRVPSKKTETAIGKIVKIIECDKDKTADYSKRSYEKMQAIIGKVEKKNYKDKIIDLANIIIPEHFSMPKEEKMREKRQYFEDNRHVASPIIITFQDNKALLKDGYTSYLILKEHGINCAMAKVEE